MNAFDWRNQPLKIDIKEIQRSYKTSYQATQVVNRQRKNGLEPSAPVSTKKGAHQPAKPQKLLLDMPKMAKYGKKRHDAS